MTDNKTANRKWVEIEHEGHVSTVKIVREDKLNAINKEVLDDLRSAFDEIANRANTRCVILTGSGKAFVAGADIAAMGSMGSKEAKAFAEYGQQTFDMIERLHCPVIAAVNGFALGGGCELALSCDFIYASEKAKFGQPEVKLGIIPGFGGTQRLPRRVGIGHARELIYSSKMIDAEEAKRIGLANQVFPHEKLLEKAKELALEIASMGPIAVDQAKIAIQNGQDKDLLDANAIEVTAFSNCFGTEDQKEGIGAFLEKRDPTFTRT